MILDESTFIMNKLKYKELKQQLTGNGLKLKLILVEQQVKI